MHIHLYIPPKKKSPSRFSFHSLIHLFIHPWSTLNARYLRHFSFQTEPAFERNYWLSDWLPCRLDFVSLRRLTKKESTKFNISPFLRNICRTKARTTTIAKSYQEQQEKSSRSPAPANSSQRQGRVYTYTFCISDRSIFWACQQHDMQLSCILPPSFFENSLSIQFSCHPCRYLYRTVQRYMKMMLPSYVEEK